jgi:clan AA aspartic protease
VGVFKQSIEISTSADGQFVSVEAMVDTGATYTWIPAETLDQLGVQPKYTRPFIMADGREIQKEMGTIVVRINGREHPTPCIFGDRGSLPLLGAVTLEELGYGVDPVNQRLVEITAYLLSAQLRRRVVEASEPGAEPACRLTREEGQQRQADTDRLFAALAEQREAGGGNEFVFLGDRAVLWDEVSVFVDEEGLCCPFFTFEQTEQADGVTLRVTRAPEGMPADG